jgi:Scaffold protein Nfu/NifU N terminal
MSEYITVEAESTDDPDLMKLRTNLNLAPDGPETYASRDEGDEGSPLAQTLFGIDGLAALDIEGGTLTARRDPEAEWHALIDDITEALKDFFL